MLAGDLAEGHREVDPEVAAERLQSFLDEPPIAARPRRNRAVGQRLAFIGHHALRIEVHGGTESLTVRARSVGRIERERAGRHLRHADPAINARQAPREQPIAAVERVDDDDVVGQVERNLNRLAQPSFRASTDDQPVHDDLNRMVAPAVQPEVLLERPELAVHPGLGEPPRPQPGELLLELALAAAHDGREHVDACVERIQHHHVHDALERLRGDLLAAAGTVGDPDAGKQEPEVVVDLGHRPDRRSRIRSRRLLLDGDGGG